MKLTTSVLGITLKSQILHHLLSNVPMVGPIFVVIKCICDVGITVIQSIKQAELLRRKCVEVIPWLCSLQERDMIASRNFDELLALLQEIEGRLKKFQKKNKWKKLRAASKYSALFMGYISQMTELTRFVSVEEVVYQQTAPILRGFVIK